MKLTSKDETEIISKRLDKLEQKINNIEKKIFSRKNKTRKAKKF
jgi:tetrahydromethanopterin S-methyltransferase subunit G